MGETQQQEITILRRIRFPTSEWYERSDGIIVVVTPDNIHYSLNDGREFVKAMREFTGGVPKRILIIPGRHMTVDKDARTFMATPEALQGIQSLAILLTSMGQRVVGNLFMTLDKPVKPTRFFETMNEAINWLKEQ